MTAEELAPYGIGTPDADGWYPDYNVPLNLRPTNTAKPAKKADAVVVDGSILALVTHWQLVVADLALHFHVDLYDPAVQARPWPGVRTMIFSLLDQPTRLRQVLTRR